MPTDSSARCEDDDSFFSSADFELFSLFVQYPDMTSNPDESTSSGSSTTLATHDSLQTSSPSTVPDEDIHNSSFFTFSTARTTPLRPLILPEFVQPRQNSWTAYLRLVQECKIPQEGLQYFTALGQAIVTIGHILFCNSRDNQDVNVLELGKWLLTCMSYSSHQIKRCITRIGNLENLSAFSYQPAESQVWSTYQQRARLIIANTSLPSKTEQQLLESLVHLYDVYVYNSFLCHPLGRSLNSKISKLLDNIYHHLMDWLAQYQRWCRDMSELRNRYVKPLLDSMATSPIAQEELMDFQRRLAQAKSILKKPIRISDEITDKTIVKILNLSARRVGKEHGMPPKRTRTRYKREHTI